MKLYGTCLVCVGGVNTTAD